MIECLDICQFRNHQLSRLFFESSSVCFIGANGQGKTNLLEAIYFLSTLRSFRTSRLNDLKKIGSPSFQISLSFQSPNTVWKTKLFTSFGEKKIFSIEGNPVHKASDFIYQFLAIPFSPLDLLIIQDSASFRRRFFDMLLSSLDPQYFHHLSLYHHALMTRNLLLKQKNNQSLIESYEIILADSANYIYLKREEISKILTDVIFDYIIKMTDQSYSFNIKPCFSLQSSDNHYILNELKNNRKKDLQKGMTTIGPHLDEWIFEFDERPMRQYASTGQIRLIALCLRLAQYQIYNQQKKLLSVALVDDVLGELDENRRQAFLNELKKIDQIFYTFTEVQSDLNLKNSQFFTIHNGSCHHYS